MYLTWCIDEIGWLQRENERATHGHLSVREGRKGEKSDSGRYDAHLGWTYGV